MFKRSREPMPESRVVQYVIEFEGLEPNTIEDYEQFVTDLAKATGSSSVRNPLWSEHFTTTSASERGPCSRTSRAGIRPGVPPAEGVGK
jgi:hypothetical protein